MIKQSDIAMIILVAGISLLASFLIGNSLINTPENRSAEVEVVNPISPTLPEPSPEIFNDEAINPTEEIIIGGEEQGETPFQQIETEE